MADYMERGIHKTEDYVEYMGVRLPRAEKSSGILVPKPPDNFYEDEEVLRLERDLALNFLMGDMAFIEGGSSLGKTTTVKKMAADLGWELHYMNLHGNIDPDFLMGRYIPNPDDQGPKHIFAHSPLSAGLTVEPGKIKIVLLDEYNAGRSNVLKRVHEILDSLQTNATIVHTEKAGSATIQTSREHTKIVAIGNAPGQGNQGLEPLDKPQIRRWVYLKLPSELTYGTFSHGVDAAFGLAPAEKPGAAAKIERFTPNKRILTREELAEIPGIADILEAYKEFHEHANKMREHRRVAADQPQKFTFDPQMERQHLVRFVARFYRGDITETVQQALRYYYLNKLESQADKARLDEAIRLVAYVPAKGSSQRRSIKEKLNVQLKEDSNKQRFTEEQRAELELAGYRIYELSGKTINEMEAEGLVVTGDAQFNRNEKSFAGQVAIPGKRQFDITTTGDTTFSRQSHAVELHGMKLGIDGVEAVIGSAADMFAVLQEEANQGRNTLGNLMKRQTLYFRTSTSKGRGSDETIIINAKDNGFESQYYSEDNTHRYVVVLPIIRPI